MSSKQRQDDFLARAKEAEEKAAAAKDESAKSAWLRIAAGYHDLAARHVPPKGG
jgi:hypothetical protein